MQLPYLAENAPLLFPDTALAMEDPDGLLCAGGDLSPERLLLAYRSGIFPWFNEGDPILWWSPGTRCTITPEKLRINRSLRKTIARPNYQIRFDSAFEDVITACAGPRSDSPGTWITEDMRSAYTELYRLGHAHSVECWMENELAGGLYGVSIGPCFFGESMFSQRSNASKLCLAWLCSEQRYRMVDCQMPTEHLLGLGAESIPRADFLQQLNALLVNHSVE